ncbi:MAG TPA: AAA family ATPase [Acidimicrobiia bacterium]|nr:AAA family ATPase [Acidimicrobiia bacterium]
MAEGAKIQGTFTILFTDLEGSTDLRIRIGDAAANEIITLHDDLVRSRLEIAGAVETKSLGDGFMALFKSANHAIQTAVSIQRAIEEHNQANPEKTLSVRMGLNSGDVTQSAGDAHGTAVHAASRVADKAQGGQILVSKVVQDLAGTLADTRIVDRGLFWLKGFPDRWRLFEVLWRDKADVERVTREARAVSAAAFAPNAARAQGAVVGRARELEVLTQQLMATPSTGLRAVVLEGEAGIGKTRMLEAAAERASEQEEPFWVLEVSADEELRGPFLLFRSLLTSSQMSTVAREAMVMEQLDRAQEAISGRGPRTEGFSPQEQMLRTFDEVAATVLALTRERSLLLMLDDLQWADDDSIQLIRYLVRTVGSAPVFLLISLRPYSDSATGGASKLIADLDRMRVTQVLRLQRLTLRQSGELLENLLGGPADESTVASLHSRSEGVPFFLEELARAYREAEALQLLDGTWTMTKLSGPAIPTSIQTLVERRLAQLNPECRSRLADAGVLGRRFRLSDLARVLAQVDGGSEQSGWQVGEELKNAIDLGLIVADRPGSGFDFSFSHDQIRASLLAALPRQRKRDIHSAIADYLTAEGGTESLSMLAHHALEAGDQALAVSSGLRAAEAAMTMSAPEEAVRLIDTTLPAASDPENRIQMLRIKDDALAVLDRSAERMANLAEMTALTAAVSSPALDAEVRLRRAAAARANEDFELAAELAQAVRTSAEASGEKALELSACLELGQAITRTPIGEAYSPLVEVDLARAEEAFQRALSCAREIGARSEEADALRELAVIEAGRAKLAAMGLHDDGTSKLEILMEAPQLYSKTKDLAEQAFRIYDELGDQQGAMSALIAMAYAHVADPTAQGMAGRIEHVRALHHSRKGEVTESQSAIDDARGLYSIHTFARLNLQPGLALERGREAFEAARAIGDRWLESLAAGGTAMTCLLVGGGNECAAWLDRAATAAMAVASTSMARRLEMWRGAHAASQDDVDEMTRHYRRAAELAGQRSPGERGEALANLAFEHARIAVLNDDESLLDSASEAAQETLDLAGGMRGQLPWEALTHAALALVAEAKGDEATAADEARKSLDIDGETHLLYFVPILWVAARNLIASGQPEAASLSAQIIGGLSYLSMSMTDPELREKWFATPVVHEVAEIVGFDPATSLAADDDEPYLSEEELSMLRELASGSVAERSPDSPEVGVLLAKLGVETANEAIQYAIKTGVTWR